MASQEKIETIVKFVESHGHKCRMFAGLLLIDIDAFDRINQEWTEVTETIDLNSRTLACDVKAVLGY